MQKKIIEFFIPAFNVEEYLDISVSSILKSGLNPETDYQISIINDGVLIKPK